MSSFCVRIQHREPHCISSSSLPSLSWSWTVSQSLLFPPTRPWQSWGILDRYPIEYLKSRFVWFSFFHGYTTVTGFWKEYLRGKVPFSLYHFRGTWYSHATAGGVNLHHVVKVMISARLIHYKGTILPFPGLFFRKESRSPDNTQGDEVGIKFHFLKGVCICMYYLEFCKEDLSFLPIYLCIQ